MSKTVKFTLVLSVFALAGFLFVLAGCEAEKPKSCCGTPGAAGCCASAEGDHDHSAEEAAAKCCGDDPSKCCGKEAAAKCCGDDASKCCGKEAAKAAAKCCGDDSSKCCGSK